MKNGHGQGKAGHPSFKLPSPTEVFLVLAFGWLTAWSYEAHPNATKAFRTPGFSTPALNAPATLNEVERRQQAAQADTPPLDPAYRTHEKQWAESLSGGSAQVQFP